MKRHRDVFVAQNAIANGSNIIIPDIPDSPTQAAILHELNNPGPSCSKKRKFDNKDDEFISTLISSDIDMFGLHGDNTTGQG